MSCHCHGPAGTRVMRAAPYDQCTTCAYKHVNKAWQLFNEFTYTPDNREAISGQLRLAADHLMYGHRGTALMCRDLAVAVEEARDAETGEAWAALLASVRELFAADHPEVAERLAALRRTGKGEKR